MYLIYIASTCGLFKNKKGKFCKRVLCIYLYMHVFFVFSEML